MSDQEIEMIFQDIIDEIVDGKAVRNILRMPGMPSVREFYKWLDEREGYSERYARATEMRADALFDSIEQDYLAEPEMIQTQFGLKIDNAWVQLQRLKIDAKKWKLAKLAPKRFSDKIDITSAGEKLEAQPAVWNVIDGKKKDK